VDSADNNPFYGPGGAAGSAESGSTDKASIERDVPSLADTDKNAGKDLVACAVCVNAGKQSIEFTYQVPITESWFVQPDVQYIVHPGGNVANQPDPSGHLAIRKRNRTRRAHDAELLGRNCPTSTST
jgi:porin